MQYKRFINSSIAMVCFLSGCAFDMDESAVVSKALSQDPDTAKFPYEDLDDDGIYDAPDPVTGLSGDRDITFELMNPDTLAGSATCSAGTFCTGHSVVFPRKLKKFESDRWIHIDAENVIVKASLRTRGGQEVPEFSVPLGIRLKARGEMRIGASVVADGKGNSIFLVGETFDIAPRAKIEAQGSVVMGANGWGLSHVGEGVRVTSHNEDFYAGGVEFFGQTIVIDDSVTMKAPIFVGVTSSGDMVIGKKFTAISDGNRDGSGGQISIGTEGNYPPPFPLGRLYVGANAILKASYYVSSGSGYEMRYGPGSQFSAENLYFIGGGTDEDGITAPLVFNGVRMKNATRITILGDAPIEMRDAAITLPKNTACSVRLNPLEDYQPNPHPVDLTGTAFKNLQPESQGGDDAFNVAGSMHP